jgi:hypothetical protein
VRQQTGLRDAPGASDHAKAVYDQQDWTKSQYLTADPDARLYACGCSVVVVTGWQAAHMPNQTWTCKGHPPVNAPAGQTLTVLPAMTLEAAMNFAVDVANSHFQKKLKLLALTFTDGTGTRAIPSNISLGGAGPALKVWTSEHQESPIDLDFSKLAGACVQLTDVALHAF